MRRSSVVLGCVVCAMAGDASAYWAENHKDLNRQVFREGIPFDQGFQRGRRRVETAMGYMRDTMYISGPDKLLVRGVGFQGFGDVIGTDKPGNTPDAAHTLQEWVAMGGLWEDGFQNMDEATRWGGRRAVNHFHDPLSTLGGGYTGLTDLDVATAKPFVDLTRRGISVTQWVNNGVSGGATFGKNEWGYPTIGTSLHKAFSEDTPVKRNAALAAAFRAMGQVMHLVEDNTVPDHARDLAHPGDGWEEYMANSRPGDFGGFRGDWLEFGVRNVETGGLRAFWDRDVYNASHAVDFSPSDTPGLCEYVGSNFLAWNRFSRAFGVSLPFAVDFSTIPEFDHTPYRRYAGVSVNPLNNFVRGNYASYPFPQTAPGTSPSLPSTAPGSIPFSPAAVAPPTPGGLPPLGPRELQPVVWSQYASRLMGAAHGYAQGVLSLVMQPARAELVTAQDGTLLKVGVRLWNLHAGGSPHAVTWHIDELRVVSLGPDAAGNPFLDRTPIVIPGTPNVAPGANVETDKVAITWKQRNTLSASSHVAVLVTAHLGDGNNQTPLLFSVPVPQAFALIQQTGGRDTTPPFQNNVGNCETMPQGCDYSGETATYRNPLLQTVSGSIRLVPTELDVRGKKADAMVREAQRQDARISEIMLFAWPRGAMQQDFVPVLPTVGNLTLNNGNLVRRSNGHWVRSMDAPDDPDTEITFNATLDLRDFYVNDMEDQANAWRAYGSVYVGVFTTAGGFYTQRIILWPIHSNRTAQEVIGMDGCNVTDTPRPNLLTEDRGICLLNSVPVMMCEYEQYRLQTVFADNGVAATQLHLTNPDFTQLPISEAWGSAVRPLRFMGQNINLTTQALLPSECDASQLSQTYPLGNGTARCDVMAALGLAYFHAEYTEPTPGNSCPNDSKPGATAQVRYKFFFFPEVRRDYEQVLGLTTLPPEWEFDLTR